MSTFAENSSGWDSLNGSKTVSKCAVISSQTNKKIKKNEVSYTTFIWKVICSLIRNYAAAMLLIHLTKQECTVGARPTDQHKTM